MSTLAYKTHTMMKQKKVYVNHPRYGNKPIISGCNYSRDEIEKSHWHYSSLKYFPETAIPANIEKQNDAIYPRSIYVDIEIKCELCHRLFIFFAKEQKHWFENLGFWIGAHCTRCIDCRRKDHEIKSFQMGYQELVNKKNRTKKETKRLKKFALELYQLGYIKDVNKINKIS